MPYIPDFSNCHCFPMQNRYSKAIGWLSREAAFEMAEPKAEILDRLWDFCALATEACVSHHFCDICEREDYGIAEKNGVRLILGNAEIQVFGADGEVYTAPNLIYHYVHVHHYKLPDKFVEALMHGPKPPEPAYFERLKEYGFAWKLTWDADGRQIPKFVKVFKAAVERHFNCKVRQCGAEALAVDWQEDTIPLDSFRLIDHPEHKYARAWYLKPKGEDPRPYLGVKTSTNPWTTNAERAEIQALVDEHPKLDAEELNEKYKRFGERFYTQKELSAEHHIASRTWPGEGSVLIPESVNPMYELRDLSELNITENGKPVERPAPSDELVGSFREHFGIAMLDSSHIELLRHANGGRPELNCFKTGVDAESKCWVVDRFYCLDEERSTDGSLWVATEEWRKFLNRDILPFAEDEAGNPFLLDLSRVPNSVEICLREENMKIVKLCHTFQGFINGLYPNHDDGK